MAVVEWAPHTGMVIQCCACVHDFSFAFPLKNIGRGRVGGGARESILIGLGQGGGAVDPPAFPP